MDVFFRQAGIIRNPVENLVYVFIRKSYKGGETGDTRGEITGKGVAAMRRDKESKGRNGQGGQEKPEQQTGRTGKNGGNEA